MGKYLTLTLIQNTAVSGPMKTRALITTLASLIPSLYGTREQQDNFESIRAFWVVSGYAVPDTKTLVEGWGMNSNVGKWDRSVAIVEDDE